MRNALMQLALCSTTACVASAAASDRVPTVPVRIVVQLAESARLNIEGFGFGIAVQAFDSDRIIVKPMVDWEPKSPELVRELGLDRYFSVKPAPGWGWVDVIAELPEGAIVLGLEPTGVLHMDDSSLEIKGEEYPNDSLFPVQYSLVDDSTGIGSLGAWRETYGDESVVIAVVDSGVSPGHSDLMGQLVTGYNAIDGSSNTDDGSASHGTHIAGIAAASTDNGIGIAGVSRGSKIMPIKSFYSAGFGLETDVAEGIIWATDHGADVISMSFGFRSVLGPMTSAIRYAYENGVVLVGSTGNVPTQEVGYPARFAAVIGVGATGRDGALWASTSTGHGLALVAPGERILSTWDTPTEPNTYREKSGTSMATPHVSGLAGLILSIAPSLTGEEVFRVLIDSARDLGEPGVDDLYGSGMIDASAAVHMAYVLATNTCRADLNGDGIRDSADIIAFVDAYLMEDPKADVAIPFGVFDLEDISRYLKLYLDNCED